MYSTPYDISYCFKAKAQMLSLLHKAHQALCRNRNLFKCTYANKCLLSM